MTHPNAFDDTYCPEDDAAAAPDGDAVPVEAAPEVGSVFGSYQLQELVGSGAMGWVYRAKHVTLGREVAVKMLQSRRTSDGSAVHRFFAEAKVVNTVRHPGLIEVMDFVNDDDGPVYMVQELLQGCDLGARLSSGMPLSRDHAIDVALQIADAMQAAHDAHVVHRDLKPENIFLVDDDDQKWERVKVLDFGVAKLTNADFTGEATAAGSLIGTPRYMAPEQINGQPVDARADIYSLGAILFEMSTGEPPFVAGSLGGYILAHMTQVPPRVDVLQPVMGVGWADLVAACLAKAPEDRPQSMRDVQDALLALRDGPVVLPEVVLPGPTSTSSAEAPDTSTSRAWAAFVAVVAVVVLAGGMWWATSSSNDAPPATSPAVVVAPPTPPTPPPVVEVTWQLRTTPVGATVVDDDTGAVLGTTPWTTTRPADDALRVTLQLAGHQPHALTWSAEGNATADVVLRPTPAPPPRRPPAVKRTKPAKAQPPPSSQTPPASKPKTDRGDRRRVLNPFD